MKTKILIASILALAIAAQAQFAGYVGIQTVQQTVPAPITALQKCPTAGITSGGPATTLTCTFTGANTPGSTIVAFGAVAAGSATLSVADTVNTYSAAGFANTSGIGSLGATSWNVFCASNSSSSTLTLTLTSSVSAVLWVGAIELTNSTCSVDTQVSTNATAAQSNPFSTSVAGDVVIAIGAGGSGSTPTVGNIAGSTATLIGATTGFGWEFRVLPLVLGNQTANFASPAGTVPSVVAYKPSNVNALTLPGPTSALNNIGQSSHWLTYCVSGSPTAVIIQLEESSNGVSWTQLSDQGTQTSGCQVLEAGGFYPLLRVNLLTLSGGSSPSITAYYSASTAPLTGAGSGTVRTRAPAALQCPNTSAVTENTSGTFQVIAGVSGKMILLCSIMLSGVNATTNQNLTLESGTGATCTTPTPIAYMAMSSASGSPAVAYNPWAVVPVGQSVCLVVAAASTLIGNASVTWIYY
jgi:hypothetical protein